MYVYPTHDYIRMEITVLYLKFSNTIQLSPKCNNISFHEQRQYKTI